MTDQVLDAEVYLLNQLRVARRDSDRDVGCRGKRPVFAEQPDNGQAVAASFVNRGQHVSRTSTGADRDQDIAPRAQRLDLAREYAVEANIVRIRREKRGVRRQRNRR